MLKWLCWMSVLYTEQAHTLKPTVRRSVDVLRHWWAEIHIHVKSILHEFDWINALHSMLQSSPFHSVNGSPISIFVHKKTVLERLYFAAARCWPVDSNARNHPGQKFREKQINKILAITCAVKNAAVWLLGPGTSTLGAWEERLRLKEIVKGSCFIFEFSGQTSTKEFAWSWQVETQHTTAAAGALGT